MKKTLSVLGLAVAVLVVGLALTSGYADKALGKSTCPSGTQKLTHVCIETTPRTGQIFHTASAFCAGLGRRLPTAAELDAFRQQPGIEISTTVYEWTGDILSSTNALGMLENGSYNSLPFGATQPFRCVK